MDIQQDWNSSELEKALKEISTTIWAIAKRCEDDHHCLLMLLRSMESLHREIREGLFEPSLPNTRNALSSLLREIEESGGWPYIERMRLQALLKNLESEENAQISETK
ncbi:hypothetical protein HC931_00145 [Candidatus Gracilibacteria bacterium]|jgi:hypothetical protein|nr:hypothetical protein [Candidatus Gracilibacteria bacterium]NJM85999.1 hypothetical protein [Hydrococcus sp. RU_2_2]NJP17656.1 hypothetical protein [Hydrococcus sp. CRU_1_1]